MSKNSQKLETLIKKVTEIREGLDLTSFIDSMLFFALNNFLDLIEKTDTAIFENLVSFAGAIVNTLEQMFKTQPSEPLNKYKTTRMINSLTTKMFQGKLIHQKPQTSSR